ncbi:MAG TPA: carbohydrate-binding domain-containing protein [Aggregatilinea sp.]|uniref:carbohydrate-binding domain-containing protein n=1 Tax=Aggregatilinea sp. TaxID=2806333 RepID=UPI002C524466|nr:carbohydrate-binding domain-containing protein [Aggregatilinea sp.]HML22272.1 carbohydrate-binding domain-containing protein [Aggregatilinea sp.]
MGKRWISALLICGLVLSMGLAYGQGLHLASASSSDVLVGAGVWQSADATQIVLNGDSIAVDGSGVTVEGSTATIVAAGSYRISGTLADGQIVVDTDDEGAVTLILNGAGLSSSTGSPLSIMNADSAEIVLQEGTENTISDGATYVFPDPEEDEPNAALFSKSDLTISGSGALTVSGNYNDGIASKDGLTITGGTISVSAADDGIRGKDFIVVEGGTITVAAGGDGLKSDNADDAALGYITVSVGIFNVTAGADAVQAETALSIRGGEFVLFSGGGSGTYIDETLSAKGLKAGVSVQIDGGTFTIDSADDAIHSNDSIVINGGAFILSTGDDGVHADATLDINDGDINITRSYEGIESAVITINGGSIRLVASDDGLNGAGGNDGSGTQWGPGQGGGPGGGGPRQGGGQMGQAAPAQGGTGQDAFAVSGDYFIYINGGTTVVDAGGDGVDVNGSIEMTGGTVIVNGPTENMNGALDYDGTFTLSGGFLVMAGSAGMAQAPSETSTQNSLLLTFDSMQAAGTVVHIQSSDGSDVLTFAPTKAFQSIIFSSPDLATGATYDVYYGGTTTGAAADGLYADGSYVPGTSYTGFTVSGVVTRIGGGTFRN